MENRLKETCWTLELTRHSKKQVPIDRAALQLVFKEIIEGTEDYGRQSGIQTMVAGPLSMYRAFRSGSLQANHNQNRQSKMYIQLRHCRINCIKKGRWSVTIDFENWKGFSGIVGRRSTFTFGPVVKAHNVIFDVALLLTLDLLGRGALAGIETFDELVDFKGAIVKIKEDFLNYPLFLKRGPCGMTLLEGEPSGPHTISANIECWGTSAGISGMSFHAIRRGTAEEFVWSLGKEKTLCLMNHSDRLGVTLDEHYSTLQTLPLVEIYHRDITGSRDPNISTNTVPPRDRGPTFIPSRYGSCELGGGGGGDFAEPRRLR
ncbi:hypothetical protein RhiJN_26688 [Ceratobasidium sp. AG-Ba]|nr:hypothetical protein RhiJN_26688 [Ceratobasidium sp. AG-Ba]